MKGSRLLVGPLAILGVTGCLATKGDIRLLQDELRATRSAVARSDSAHRRTSDSLAAAVNALRTSQTRGDQALQQSQQQTTDAAKALTARVGSLELTTKEKFRSIDDELSQVQELARQSVRGSALARAQQEQAAATAPPVSDSTAASGQPAQPSGAPGPATLLITGRSQIIQGSCATARRIFQDVLTSFPDSPEAPEAQYSIGESYVSCGDGGNTAKADSVYKLVTDKYPKSDFAATSLYKRAEMQRSAGKMDVARPLYQRVVCEYPKSTVFDQALNRLGSRPVCR
jgi:TolA-binding protein